MTLSIRFKLLSVFKHGSFDDIFSSQPVWNLFDVYSHSETWYLEKYYLIYSQLYILGFLEEHISVSIQHD